MAPAPLAAKAEALTVRRGGRTLGPFSLELAPAEIVALVGPNGAGKSTLIRLLLGIDRPDSGVATIGGVRVSPLAPPQGTGYVPDHDRFWDWASALENLRPFARDGRAPEATLELVGLDVADLPVRAFSRGMRQRLSLARALLTATDLLVLAEPTIAVDSAGVAELVDVLRTARDDGLAILTATHDADFARLLGARLVAVEAGRTQ